MKENEYSEEMLRYLWLLLSSSKLPENHGVNECFADNQDFKKIVQFIVDLRKLSHSLNKGELLETVGSRGYIISNLKALQSNLQHLTWQTKKVAGGDFTQKVDFLGDFSDSFNEMTEKLRSFSDELTRLANHDPLTKIANRLSLEQFLMRVFTRFLADKEPFCVLLLDVDFFKKVNDRYGHDVGDMVLIKLSDTLKVMFRDTDMFARYGGEEFIVVLSNSELKSAQKTANRVLQEMRKMPVCIGDDSVLYITVSIGVSQALPEDQSYNDVIKRSDQALFKAKENGRNQVVVF